MTNVGKLRHEIHADFNHLLYTYKELFFSDLFQSYPEEDKQQMRESFKKAIQLRENVLS